MWTEEHCNSYVKHQQIHFQFHPQHTHPPTFQRPSADYSEPSYNKFGKLMRRLVLALASAFLYAFSVLQMRTLYAETDYMGSAPKSGPRGAFLGGK